MKIFELGEVLAKEEFTNIPFDTCPTCGDAITHESATRRKERCLLPKVKSRYKVWSKRWCKGVLVPGPKKGAKNWGNKSKK